MAKGALVIPRVLLLFLICSSCAWVGNGAADGPVPGSADAREAAAGGAGDAARLGTRTVGEADGRNAVYPRLPPAAPAHVVRDGCRAMITPPPSLRSRQDQGQIQALSNQLQQLSEQSRSVSQASQQLSQSSQQLSQSLQQASQRLSQTEQQLASARLQQNAAESASRSMSQAAAEASRRADEASASADRAISEAIRSASQSASRLISDSLASVTSSMGASFSSAISLASESAANAVRSAASAAQKAQADATALRDEANDQIQQAQGAALSVTQTALAVVGGIIGSSLLTGVAFVVVLRCRRKKRRQLCRGNGTNGSLGYPQLAATPTKAYSIASLKNGDAPSDDGSSTYSTDDKGFRFPLGNGSIGRPVPAAAPAASSSTVVPRKSISTGVGYAISYYGPRAAAAPPPPVQGNVVPSSTATVHTAGPPTFQLGNPPPPRGGKFSLFPRPKGWDEDGGSPQAASPPASSSAGGAGVGPRAGQGLRQVEMRASSGSVPTLDKWLKDGTTVSPFSTLKGLKS